MALVIRRSRSRVAAVFLLCSSLLLSGFATDQARAGPITTDRAVVLQLTNEARDQKGRDPLELDRALSRYAVRHSRAMAREGELFHSADLAAVLQGRNWELGGENLGVGPSLSALQAAFMRSAPHRRNILQEGFAYTAIGVVRSDGNFWVTVIFYG